jgi:D-alanyl-D-alanine carboxypeptidase/D-alanyl-D-alanine-endopeptidase (penicillin-binding protein 4)
MIGAFGAVLFWVTAGFGGGALYEKSRDELAEALSEIHASHAGFDERLDAVTRAARGTPYRFDPLGEGSAGTVDKEPIVNWRRVDCLTFVEQSMAFARRGRLDEAIAELQRIRYHDGKIDFASRNHFMAAWWLKRNAEAGFVRDVTREVGGDATRLLRKDVSPRAWEGRNRKWVRRIGFEKLPKTYEIAYVPIGVALRFASRIPNGTILSDVREALPTTPVTVSHTGFVMEVLGRKVFRHASGRGRFVEDTPLERYLRYLKQSVKERQAGRPWRVLGINLAKVLPPNPR